MSARATDVDRGMDVYSADGEKVGTVVEVWAQTTGYGLVPKSDSTLASSGPIDAPTNPLDTEEGYLEVHHGGVDAAMARRLYFPLREVATVDGDRVALAVAVEVISDYEQKPA